MEQHLKETEGVRTIRIGANLSVGVKMLRGFIRAFEKKYPDIQVKVTVSGSVRLMELLKTHQIDLGLMEICLARPTISRSRLQRTGH